MLPPDFDHRLRAMAGVIVRIGLNLQPGQPLLITDPYELQGVPPEALGLAEAVNAAAGGAATVIAANPAHLRRLVESGDRHGLDALLSQHIAQLHRHLAAGGAFLFLTGGAPRLFDGLHAVHVTQFEQLKWRHLGPVIQELLRGATQWTLAPAPTPAWADVAYPELPAPQRLAALWEVVFASLQLGAPDPIIALRTHLAALALRCDGLNAAHHRQIRYVGAGTDLTLNLSRTHVWCTAQFTSRRGIPYVVNLPTEEVYTAPHKDSATGRLRVARPVIHAGSLIDGITLEFAGGRVTAAQATTGHDLLQQLLATDEGAGRIGEVAIVPARTVLSQPGRCFQHTLLDENAANHIALGDAYRFCSSAWLPLALNSSQIHVDLPLDARVELA